MNTVFLIGNGDSRRGFLLSRLRHKGVIIGCNKAYQDFPYFDAIVSIDSRPSQTIEKEFGGMHIFNNALKTNNIYLGSLTYTIDQLPELADKPDSGKVGAWIARRFFKADRLIMLGMDFGGVSDLYSPTKFKLRDNYRDDWTKLLEGFKEVIKVGNFKQECEALPLRQITYEEFEDMI